MATSAGQGGAATVCPGDLTHGMVSSAHGGMTGQSSPWHGGHLPTSSMWGARMWGLQGASGAGRACNLKPAQVQPFWVPVPSSLASGFAVSV